MHKMSIKLKIEGFEDLLNKIQATNGSIDKAVDSAARQSAQILQNELKSQMQQSGVNSRLINAMPEPQIFKDGNAVVAKVGYEKGEYDTNNLSDGYKVLFLNYGTPHRKKHGKIVSKGFIQRAKKGATPKIKKAQKEVYEKILSRLEK